MKIEDLKIRRTREVDMSAAAITQRFEDLDQLVELAFSLRAAGLEGPIEEPTEASRRP